MTLIFFKYALPIILGYTMFVGISGQYTPFRRPTVAIQRPLWFLGLWIGMATSIIVIVGLQLAFRLELNELSALAVPSIAAISATLLPGIIGFFWYRWRVHHRTSDNSEQQSEPQATLEPEQEPEPQSTPEPQSLSSIKQQDAKPLDNTLATNASTSDTSEETESVDNIDRPETNEQQSIWAANKDNRAMPEIGMDETLMLDVDPADYKEPVLVDHTEPVSETAAETTGDQELIRLRAELEAEVKTRKELEMHLRITRNGLGALESESREFESNKATALIKIERELEEKVKRTSAAEARADRELAKRVELENKMVQLRADTLKATTECRVSTEARANALGTANKAATLARQAIKIRARLEEQLKDAKDELDRKQTTISSLIKALEKEKSRTQKDVTSMAKQLRLHEKQLQARRTLEEVSRSVDKKLSTRLVKKVAKARS